MNKQTMERRDFLKRMGSLFLGITLMPLVRLIHKEKDFSGKTAPMKEAMHYTSGDNLAG